MPSAGFRSVGSRPSRGLFIPRMFTAAGRGAKPAVSMAKPAELAETVPAYKRPVRTVARDANTRTG